VYVYMVETKTRSAVCLAHSAHECEKILKESYVNVKQIGKLLVNGSPTILMEKIKLPTVSKI
jgi:hypothetical protein